MSSELKFLAKYPQKNDIILDLFLGFHDFKGTNCDPAQRVS